MLFDTEGFNQIFANSASMVAEVNSDFEENLRAIELANQEQIQREEKMVAGAEASIAQKELLEQQVDLLHQQNALLQDNYSKLKEMFETQVKINEQDKEELKRSKRFNLAMMVISIVAMLAAIAGPIATILVSK